MLVPHPHFYNRTGFQDIDTEQWGNPGHIYSRSQLKFYVGRERVYVDRKHMQQHTDTVEQT